MTENCDRRVLGGFQCVDAITLGSIIEPLKVSSSQLLLRPNRSGVYAVWDAPGLRKYTSFDPLLPWPDPTAFEIAIEDPSLFYLPRRGNIRCRNHCPPGQRLRRHHSPCPRIKPSLTARKRSPYTADLPRPWRPTGRWSAHRSPATARPPFDCRGRYSRC